LHLPHPFCYARDSYIPFAVTLESDQAKALSRLVQPSHFKVILEEITVVGPAALGWTPVYTVGGHQNTFRRSLGRARLTSTTEIFPAQYRIEGTIRLPRAAKPSFTFVGVKLHYAISVLIEPVGFKWDGKLPQAVASQEVVITTDPAHGATPRSPAFSRTQSEDSAQGEADILDEMPTLQWK